MLQKIFANTAGGMTLREAIAAAETSMAAYRRQDEAVPAEKPNPFVPADAGTQTLPNDQTAKELDSRGACPRAGGDGNERMLHPRSPRHRGPRVRQL